MWQHSRNACGFYQNIFARRSTAWRESLKTRLLFLGEAPQAIRRCSVRKHFPFATICREIWKNQSIEYSRRMTRNSGNSGNKRELTRRPSLRDRGLRLNPKILSPFVHYGRPFCSSFAELKRFYTREMPVRFCRSFTKHLLEIGAIFDPVHPVKAIVTLRVREETSARCRRPDK